MRAAVLSDNLRLTLHMPACYIIRFPNALGLTKKPTILINFMLTLPSNP